MSARVFKPLHISDVPKMKTVSLFEGKLIYNKNITRVRRALFNPNPEETRRFLNEEFAKMAKSESNKWNFDFVAGRPMNINGQFEWQPIRGKPLRDEVARSTKRQTDIHDNSQLYPPIETTAIDDGDDCNQQDEQMSIDLPVEEVIVPKKQSLITDFMKTRKRIEERSSSTKKLDPSSPTQRPPKIPRLSLMDSSS